METVKIIECPRDAWQGLPGQIPTERKVEYLRELVRAGFRHIDAVSFVSPKAVPQMADSEEVLRALAPAGDVGIIGIVVNEKGAERAIASAGVSVLGYPCSVSETFLRRNQNQSLDENRAVLARIKKMADDEGLDFVAYISMAFGNPYNDPWSEKQTAEAAHAINALGVNVVSIADTAGVATPDLISRVCDSVLNEVGGCEVGIHLHTTRQTAREKILAAYDAGCRRFDSAIGGLGGCPFAQDELVGNVPTEETLVALQERGVAIPISDLADALALNDEISREFGEGQKTTNGHE